MASGNPEFDMETVTFDSDGLELVGDLRLPEGEGPYAYYGTERGLSTRWANEVTRRSIHALLTFDDAVAATVSFLERHW